MWFVSSMGFLAHSYSGELRVREEPHEYRHCPLSDLAVPVSGRGHPLNPVKPEMVRRSGRCPMARVVAQWNVTTIGELAIPLVPPERIPQTIEALAKLAAAQRGTPPPQATDGA